MDNILPKQNCPLCNQVVIFVGINVGRRKKINCPHCGIYKISLSAEEAILKLPQHQKEMISKASVECNRETTLSIWIDKDTKQIKYDCVPSKDLFLDQEDRWNL